MQTFRQVCYCTRLSGFFALEFLNQINTGQADGTPGLDLNVAEAWELGYTGKGVTIGIMDDGEYLNAFTPFGSKCVFACLWNIRVIVLEMLIKGKITTCWTRPSSILWQNPPLPPDQWSSNLRMSLINIDWINKLKSQKKMNKGRLAITELSFLIGPLLVPYLRASSKPVGIYHLLLQVHTVQWSSDKLYVAIYTEVLIN